MNKFLLPLLLAAIQFSNLKGQSGKVGINTSNPTENLTVNGSLRINKLPQNKETNAIYTTPEGNASETRNQTYNYIDILTVDKNGVVGSTKTVLSKTITLNNNTSKEGGTLNHDLSAQDAIDGYLFDGYFDINVTLPKCSDGQQTWFYAWGGIPISQTKTYTFKGNPTNNLSQPSGSARSVMPPGVDMNTSNTLILTSDPMNGTNIAPFRYRYSKIEFLCLGTKWFYNVKETR